MKLRSSRLFFCVGMLGVIPVLSAESAQPLTLQQTLSLALDNNFEIQISQLEPEIALDQVGQALGVYDPVVFARYTYQELEQELNSVDISSRNGFRLWEEENHRYSVGLGGKLPLGTEYEMSLGWDALENSLTENGTFTGRVYSPEYDSAIRFQLNQPILRGFGMRVNHAPVRIAEIELDKSEHRRVLAVTNTLIQIINTFYDIAFAQQNLEVKAQSKSLADQFLQEVARRQEVGRAVAIDIAQAEVRVSEAEEFLSSRQLELAKRDRKHLSSAC